MSLKYLENNGIPLYSGPLDRKKLRGDVLVAYTAWANQRRRCYTKSNPRYKDNGAKGLGVSYSARELISWYLFNISKFNGTNPSIGRKDHSKGYSFDNIQIESLADNSMERIKRVGTTRPRRSIHIIDAKTNKIIKTVASSFDVEKETGVRNTHVSKYCKGIIGQSKSGFTFRYVDEKKEDRVVVFKRKKIRRLKNEVIICDGKTSEPIFIAVNSKEIFNLTGILPSHINKYCMGLISTSKRGYSLKYGNEMK